MKSLTYESLIVRGRQYDEQEQFIKQIATQKAKQYTDNVNDDQME